MYSYNTKVNVLKKVYAQNAHSIKILKDKEEKMAMLNDKLNQQNEQLIEQVAQISIKCENLEEVNNYKTLELDQKNQELMRFKTDTHTQNQEKAAQLIDYQNQFSVQKEHEMNVKLQQLIKKERKQYEEEKTLIASDLKQKRLKIEELEKRLQESEEIRQRLETSLPLEQRELRQKFINYEKNLEQLTLMYHQLASNNKLLSREKGVQMKKLERKAEQIRFLEQQLSITRQQVSQLKNQCMELSQIVQLKLGDLKKSKAQAQQSRDTEKGEIENQQQIVQEPKNQEELERNFDNMLEKLNLGNMSRLSLHPKQIVKKSIRGGGGSRHLNQNQLSAQLNQLHMEQEQNRKPTFYLQF